jgi:serine/threonine protein kinase
VLADRRRGKDLDTFDCWSQDRNCCCFVKALRPDRLESPVRRQLVREARLLLSFAHPNLVRAYELLQVDVAEPPLLLLETIPRATLDQRLRNTARLSLPDLVLLGRQLCSVVDYLHGHRYLHLGISPRTIVVDGDRARLVDLSSARRPGRVIQGWGASTQISPEQARGGRLTRAADVWGVGLVLYQAATGHHPFAPRSRTPGRVRFLQLTTVAPPVRSLRRLPADIGTALDACLETHPADRPTLTELDASLASAAESRVVRV